MKNIAMALVLTFGVQSQATEPIHFQEVFDKVISQKCTLCHSNPGKKPFDMTNYAEVMAVVVAGSLEQSKLFQAIQQGDMPPPKLIQKDPSMALTEEEVQLIEQWILDGALE